MTHLFLDLPAPLSVSDTVENASAPVVFSPLCLGSPRLQGPAPLQPDPSTFFYTPSSLLGQASAEEKESDTRNDSDSAMMRDGAAVFEEESVRQRRLEGERRFAEAQQQAAERRKSLERNKENSPARSKRTPSSSPKKGSSGKRTAAYLAQERLKYEAYLSGRVEGGRGWWALLKESSEIYAEHHVAWVCAGEDELSIATMEHLASEARRNSEYAPSAVYLLWKLLTREAYHQRLGVSDARVARQLAAEFGNDPRDTDRAIELQDCLDTKQRVADLLLSMG